MPLFDMNKPTNFNQYENLSQAIDDLSHQFENKSAYCNAGHQLSFKEILDLSEAFAAYLQHHTDLKPGDRLGIQLLNSLQYPVVVYGAWKAGLVVVNMNPLYTVSEMISICQNAELSALVFMDFFSDKVEALIDICPIPYLIKTSLPDLFPTGKRLSYYVFLKYIKRVIKSCAIDCITWPEVFKKSKKQSLKSVCVKRNNLALLQYTGGSTGEPKGVSLTHGNLLSNCEQAYTVLMQKNQQDQSILVAGEEIMIAPLPLYHIYAFTSHLLACYATGSMNLLISNPKDISSLIRVLKKYDFFCFVGLNTLFSALLKHPEFKKCRFNRLKYTVSGGMPLVRETALQWKSITGCDISEGYGLTECSPFVTMNPFSPNSQLGTIGIPMPGTALKLIDPVTEKVVAPGESGELCVKGPQVMLGYWRKQPETQAVLDKEGWFKTGDIAEILETGYVRIIDRIKDIILVSGFNVYPSEIEKIINQHPKVALSAVVGIPDAATGEAVKLFVVKKELTLDHIELQKYCRQYLTGYKIPKHIEFREALPMTTVGKVLRRQLRNE